MALSRFRVCSMVMWTAMCMALNVIRVSARYHYPSEPYINFTMESNQTCPDGCSICSDVRYVCTSLNVTTVPQTLPATIQYLQLEHTPRDSVLGIQNNSFELYTNLRYLDISRNRIESIPDGALNGLRKLEYLKVRQYGPNFYPRSLTGMGLNTLSDLKDLKYIDFKGNYRIGLNRMVHRLKALTKSCLNCTIDYLDLSYTNDIYVKNRKTQSYVLKKSEMAVFKKINAKVLKLDGNHITSIEKDFGPMLVSLEYLSLRDNYLSINIMDWGEMYYAYSFLLMYNLKVINLGGNAWALGHLPTRKVCLPLPKNLEELYIDNSVLSKDTSFKISDLCLSSPNNLKVVEFSDSTIGKFGGSLSGFGNITYLNLQNSIIEATDPNTFNCRNFPKLQTFLLGNINLQTLYSKLNKNLSIFQNCSRITYIDLQNTNNLDPQVLTFIGMENVRYINLSNNGIISLDIDLSNNLALNVLNISSNLISQLSTSMMSQMDSIAMAKRNQIKLVVDLSSNPLLCGCKELSFIKWMKTTKVHFYDFEKYRCLGNPKYHFIHEVSIDEATLMCQMTVIVSVSTSVSVMVVLGTIALIIYAKRHRLEYFCLLGKQMVRRILQTKKQADDYRMFTYHGFLSYSTNDDISIIVKIQEKMEKEFGLSLVIHQRDFIPGEFVAGNIIHFIDASRKVVILMSNNYLESRWCKFEFELSQNKRLDATYDTMVMILLHDLKDLNKGKISPSLKSYLGQKTYLQWPKDSSQTPAFWLRLKEALDFGDVQDDTPVDDTQVNINPPQDNINNSEGEEIPSTELIDTDENIGNETIPLLV